MGSSNSIRFSAIVITYNEEKKIGNCLDSLVNVADEIIVVDSYSTDRTIEICKSKGAKVISQQFLGYANQKNFGIQEAKFDYIISLDADEVLSPELINSIKYISPTSFLSAYEVNRLTNYCGRWIKHGGWYPDPKIRIWKKGNAKWVGDGVHETLELADNTKIVKLKGDLLHFTTDTISQHIDQIQKFTTLAANELHRQGKKVSIAKILFNSWFKFTRDYVFRLGFLDGFYGFVVAFNSAFATYLKYLKLYNLNKSDEKKS
ncbi:MAG: glycosyltransferase family 2 protein [Candidatus Kapaibacterium sp.]|nr:glycosyltransferase family 2 protein [Ignavibacteriota bacterium]MCB9221970.1 glycosyltransferase family 2 protein [Ignavibacteria bacterium]